MDQKVVAEKLAILYDKDIKLMSIHPSAWALTPLFQWFENYTVISKVKNPLDTKLSIAYITDYLQPGEDSPVTVREMKESPALTRLIKDLNLQNHKMVMSKPPAHVSQISYLSNDYEIAAQYENKVWLREQFSSKLRFPKFILKSKQELRNLNFEEITSQLNTTGLVLQHPIESGGRGTHIASNQIELDIIANDLVTRIGDTEKIVISELLKNMQERSIQVCITEKETLVGPAQAQLVSHPTLTTDIPGAVQFCGGMVFADLLSNDHYQEAKDTALTLAVELRRAGYKGIFGIDFILANGKLHILEVNARLTGLTALLAFLQKTHPFLLLHILELAGAPYRLQQGNAERDITKEGSFILVYAKKDTLIRTKTGVYDSNFSYLRLGFEDTNIIPEGESEYFIAMKRDIGSVAPAGKSIAFIYSKKRLFNDEGDLEEGVSQLVTKLQSN